MTKNGNCIDVRPNMRLTLHDSLVTNANLELQVHYINKGDTLVLPLNAKRSNPHHDHYQGQT